MKLSFDIYDNQGADDFVVTAPGWAIDLVENLGVYYNGTGPATSVNVFFYTNTGGLPGTLVEQRLNVIPSGGLATGSFIIPISPAVNLTPGTYWVSIQANLDFGVGGQYGWTEHLAHMVLPLLGKIQVAVLVLLVQPGVTGCNLCCCWNCWI